MITKYQVVDFNDCPNLYYSNKEKGCYEENYVDNSFPNLQRNNLNLTIKNNINNAYYIDFDLYKNMNEKTLNAIKNGEKRIFNASFIYDDLFCLVDYLEIDKNGQFNIYGIQITSKIKKYQKLQMEFQYYVLNKLGYKVSNAGIAYINLNYIYKDKIELNKLLEYKLIDINQIDVESIVLNMRKDIINNYRNMEEIEFTKPIFEPSIEKDKLNNWLTGLKYPLNYLDFEVYQDLVPFINGSHPKDSRIFEYSLDVQESFSSKCKHYSYLQENRYDNSREVCERLINDLNNSGSILCYNSSCEKEHLSSLLYKFPEYSDKLKDIINRIVDLEFIFKHKIYDFEDPEMTLSLKSIYTKLVNDKKLYENLDLVQDGEEAIVYYEKLINSEGLEHENIKKSLLDYCALDTYAIMKIVNKLIELK